MIDLESAKKYLQKSFLPDMESAYGEQGGAVLRIIVDFLSKMFQEVEPSEFSKSIIVYRKLNANVKSLLGIPKKISRLADIKNYRDCTILIEVLDEKKFLIWCEPTDIIEQLVDNSIVYEYNNRVEYFYAKLKRIKVEKIDYDFPSVFAVPTFTVLDRALETYKIDHARRAKCSHLKKCMDKNRLIFLAAPEEVMQVSLHSYLDCTLRFNDSNVKVTREVNTGVSYPVDIKVNWINSNKSALIEIKRIGTSYRIEDWKRTANYLGETAKRIINKGNKQLAQYLENNKDNDYNPSTIGYYVIFDGRRNNLKKRKTEITKKDGFYFADIELEFSSEYHKIRSDFREPIRMFIEPICLD